MRVSRIVHIRRMDSRPVNSFLVSFLDENSLARFATVFCDAEDTPKSMMTTSDMSSFSCFPANRIPEALKAAIASHANTEF